MSSGQVLEGVLAIHKPAAISSAQVIRDVQDHFDPSKLFQPWLAREQEKRDAEGHNQKKKRKWRGRRGTSVKMGHGGTLDPMATGVLILGLGSGTKQLGHFTTECTKTYETVVLFGAATDTYDTEGKIVGRKPHDHITKAMVEEALVKFKGTGMQKPPIFSALRVQGKRLYEYAREGKEVPVEIKERPVEVHALEMTEWMDGGTHKYHWPQREAEPEEKEFAEKALHLDASEISAPAEDGDATAGAKRKRDGHGEDGQAPEEESSNKRSKAEDATQNQKDIETSEADNSEEPKISDESAVSKKDDAAGNPDSEEQQAPCPAPACRIRLKVTSGFYVRSLCQDLGAAVGSLGMMTELVRTQQGDFDLGSNVLSYEDLKQGEEVWAPKVKGLLEDWNEKQEQKANGDAA
ncbi:hypothetical protein M409DRAFT_55826 [Zasmidium cellare ATCC 36951]|uniref:tRNA pseudouridine(55) synthase n=1 Tax=Zasmidium cellare ATCC 36951 TaxID=1080233 RepID=A0A6A6CIA4_ZASCE|nr:uncharacterized protein M409DRAFT_55826 [Zasmidium cellare ATCC 36951]KAF2165429.1 hypothetical protein M409DRAFT_55826 [Zasmidium cellare ATCC 36951]